MAGTLENVTGTRGENLFELAITEYAEFPEPLFSPAFLGKNWPVVDYLVELPATGKLRPFLLAQVKSTTVMPSPDAGHLAVHIRRRDVERLFAVPGPTYLFGVLEPTKRVFVKAIHPGMSRRNFGHISLRHELNPRNLRRLHDEVRAFWSGIACKPDASFFS